MGEEEDPQLPPEPPVTPPPWVSATVVLNVDPGDGSIAAPDIAVLTAGQDATDGNKTAVVFVNRSGDRGEDDAEEDEPSHIPIAQALDSFLRVMETTATEGRQRKLDATLSQEDDSVPTENEYPDGADVVQGKEELDQPTNPDVVYVLCGYMMSSEDAEFLLTSDIVIDAVVNLRLPSRPTVPPTPTEEELHTRSATMLAFVKPCLADFFSELDDGGNLGAVDLHDRLRSLFSLAEDADDNALAESFAGLQLDDSLLTNAIMSLAADDEGELLGAGDGDAGQQADALLQQLLQEAGGTEKFAFVPGPTEPTPLVEARVTQHARSFVSEVLPPESLRNGIVWDLATHEFDSAEAEQMLIADGVVLAELSPEDAALKTADAEDLLVAKQVFGHTYKYAIDAFNSRIEYGEYVDSLTVIRLEPATALRSSDKAYYDRIVDSYEAVGEVNVTHVVYSMVEYLAEAAEAASSYTWGGDDMSLRISELLNCTVDATKGQFEAGIKLPTDIDIDAKMNTLLPLPGRDRSFMPPVAALTRGEREAFASSLYHFVDGINEHQVERALLREEFRRMLCESESNMPGNVESLDAAWDEHLTARLYSEELAPSEMAVRYQEALAAANPAASVLTTYYGRTDQLLVAIHTPMALRPHCVVRSRRTDAAPGIPDIAQWQNDVRPDVAYAIPASKTCVEQGVQSAFLSDSGTVARRTIAGKHTASAYVSGHVLTSTCDSQIFTATLADGSVLAVKTQGFKNGDTESSSFCTVTLTTKSGRSVVLNGNGSVSLVQRETSIGNQPGTLSMPQEGVLSVVSKGSVVKHFTDGCVSVAYKTGDTSRYSPTDKSWFDVNCDGCVQQRHDGVRYDQYKIPEVVDTVPTDSFVDHETNADVRSRQDRVQKYRRIDGSVLVQHADGVEMHVSTGCVAVDLKAYGVQVKVASAATEVNLDDGGSMELAWPSMNSHANKISGPSGLAPTKVLKSWPQLDCKSTITVTRPDGTVVTVRDSVVTFMPSFPGGSSYVFDLNAEKSKYLLKATDSNAGAITIQRDGTIHSSLDSDNRAHSMQVLSHAPELFVVNPDGSGYEWCVQDTIENTLSTWDGQGLLLQERMPNENLSCALTAQGHTRKLSYHPALTDMEREQFSDGVEQFAAWTASEKAGADALVVTERRTQEEILAESEIQARVAFVENDANLARDMIVKYAATPEIIASAEEYFRRFDLNSDGTVTAEEMQTQLAEWGVDVELVELARYIGIEDAIEILADRVITRGEFFSFYFPVVEMLTDTGAPSTAEMESQRKDAIARYAASADIVQSAERYFEQFELTSEGRVLAAEVQTKLNEWGIEVSFRNAEESAELPERLTSKAEWYEFYFRHIEMLEPAESKARQAGAGQQRPPITAVKRTDIEAADQYFLVHPRSVDFGIVTQGCVYRQPLSMTNGELLALSSQMLVN